MTAQLLADALEAEHHEIDGGIEQFAAGLASGHSNPAPLKRAMAALRRHIYLEESFLFPPLKADLAMPIFVMEREHGQIWDDMDELDALLELEQPESATLQSTCRELLAKLERHNEKEEPIIYAHAANTLSPELAKPMAAFLETGMMPDGWRASKAS
ncbi:hemerythrin domain-containing protein [Jonesiaceae bacterium BS-20]|uniref:Hemerythrin domain-containing protein n=1 Tax=Jonesiaceae bacterium BS-20 TaxID=3120821 RepID=A0AAU7DW15_9MICO